MTSSTASTQFSELLAVNMSFAIAVCTTAGQRRHTWLDLVLKSRFFFLIRTEARGFLTQATKVKDAASNVWTALCDSPVIQI